MDDLDRKFSAINSYVKYTTEWFEKKSWQFLFHYYYLEYVSNIWLCNHDKL